MIEINLSKRDFVKYCLITTSCQTGLFLCTCGLGLGFCGGSGVGACLGFGFGWVWCWVLCLWSGPLGSGCWVFFCYPFRLFRAVGSFLLFCLWLVCFLGSRRYGAGELGAFMRTEQIVCLNTAEVGARIYLCCGSSLNVCVACIFLFWMAIWSLCGRWLSVWLSAGGVSIEIWLFRVCVSFPLSYI